MKNVTFINLSYFFKSLSKGSMQMQFGSMEYEHISNHRKRSKICNCTNILLLFILITQILHVIFWGGLLFVFYEYGQDIIHDSNNITSTVTLVKNKFYTDTTTITSAVIEAKNKFNTDSTTITSVAVNAEKNFFAFGTSIADAVTAIEDKYKTDSTSITSAVNDVKNKFIADSNAIVTDMNNITKVIVKIEPCLEKICGFNKN